MSWFWARVMPRSIRGQIFLLTIIAVLFVITVGKGIENLVRTQLPAPVNPDLVLMRTETVARLLLAAGPAGEEGILKNAAAAGLEFVILPKAEADRLTLPDDLRSWLGTLIYHAFPPDYELPVSRRYVRFNGRLAVLSELDPSRDLLFLSIPNSILTTDMTSALTYQVLAVLTLLTLFSTFSYFVITAPLRRIADAVGNTDEYLARARPLEECGSREIVELARALNELRDRINHLLQTRTRLLQSISHDLRTPLTRMRLRVERIAEDQLRQQILLDLGHVDTMISATLDYFRTNGQSEAMEQVDIASMLQTLSADFCDAGHDVTYDGPGRLVITCQPNSMFRALTNLCDNAVRFADSGLLRLTQHGREAVVEVIDTGPGIPAHLRHHVLEPFFKIDHARTLDADRSGYGLGLSIVHEIVRHHAGVLTLHDTEPHGLTVRVNLPISQGETAISAEI
ncbi:ATP-binding protein [Lacibacterium aquatile]|uniref:histidine kinase n=1 Tax=Lacibacterium aquatile TaxID=1168082 RepID=A0ABW5DP75_9PROT